MNFDRSAFGQQFFRGLSQMFTGKDPLVEQQKLQSKELERQRLQSMLTLQQDITDLKRKKTLADIERQNAAQITRDRDSKTKRILALDRLAQSVGKLDGKSSETESDRILNQTRHARLLETMRKNLDHDPRMIEYQLLKKEAEEAGNEKPRSGLPLIGAKYDPFEVTQDEINAKKIKHLEFLDKHPDFKRKVNNYERESKKFHLEQQRSSTPRDSVGLPAPVLTPDSLKQSREIATRIMDFAKQQGGEAGSKLTKLVHKFKDKPEELLKLQSRVQRLQGPRNEPKPPAPTSPVVQKVLEIDKSNASKGSKKRQVKALIRDNGSEFAQDMQMIPLDQLSEGIRNVLSKVSEGISMFRGPIDELNRTFRSTIFESPSGLKNEPQARRITRKLAFDLLSDPKKREMIIKNLDRIDQRIRDDIKAIIDKTANQRPNESF